MASHKSILLLAFVVLPALIWAAKDKDCMDECDDDYSSCSKYCNSFRFGRGMCLSRCRGTRDSCENNCPEESVSQVSAGGQIEIETAQQQQQQTTSEWTAWGSCSVTCGQGQQSRSRQVCQQASGTCQTAYELRTCVLEPCLAPVQNQPVNPPPQQPQEQQQTTSEWTAWSSCSVSCGQGRQSRSRQLCDQRSGSCETVYELRDCVLPACFEMAQPGQIEIETAQQQQQQTTSEWTAWGSCSVTCGQGQQSRSRQVCQQPSGTCQTAYELRTCVLESCPAPVQNQPVNPPPQQPQEQQQTTSEWTAWSSCSVSCGQGQQTWSRQVCQQPSGFCQTAYEVRTCVLDPCPLPAQSAGSSSAVSTNSVSSSASSSASSSSQPKCGVANSNRVIGGTVAGDCEFPWMVVVFNQVSMVVCGGSIIDSRHILSAAHCFHELDLGSNRWYVSQPNELIIFSGSSEVSLVEEASPKSTMRRNYAEKITIHPDYTLDAKNDIAIITLTRDLPDNDCHTPICLVDENQDSPQDARGCRTMGWGVTVDRPDATASPDLRWTSVEVLDDRDCRRIYGWKTASADTLCAGGGGRDSCSGDSGGPLLCRGDGGNFYQYGIVSLGMEGQCGTIAGLYTRVSSYVDWIKSVTG